MTKSTAEYEVLGKGVYGAGDALRLVNFRSETSHADNSRISRQTLARWLRGYESETDGRLHFSAPLWHHDYHANDDDGIEVSFRDLIELRFVKAFRDAGVSLPAIRICLERAAEMVENRRPFSTSKFKTDGKTIFLDITRGVDDEALIDLRHRQTVFRSFVSPSFKDLEFDADGVARWFPLGGGRRSVVLDPAYSFGRPVSSTGLVPTQTLALAVQAEGSVERAARFYEVPIEAVRDAMVFELQLAA